MSRLIDADAFRTELMTQGFAVVFKVAPRKKYTLGEIAGMLDKRPTVDAVPVVHGHWEESNPQNSESCRLIKCSKCGFTYIVGFNVPYEDWIEDRNYCTRCGAKMDEVAR